MNIKELRDRGTLPTEDGEGSKILQPAKSNRAPSLLYARAESKETENHKKQQFLG